MSGRFALFLLFLFLFFSHAALGGETESRTKLYPLPLNEMDEVVSTWLSGKGYSVQKTSLKTGEVKLSAVRNDEEWQILLKPHSALATEVQAVPTADEKSDLSEIGNLWAHISSYIEPLPTDAPSTKAPEVEGLTSSKDIPTAVLAKIESVVCIRGNGNTGNMQSSGFVIDDRGLILSTAHELKGCSDITVSLYDGRAFKGDVIQIDPHRDLTLIHIGTKLDSAIDLNGGRDMIGMGEKLFSVGCPLDLVGTVFSGVLNGPQRRANDLVLWQVSMRIYPGSSGSPVFDIQGNLLAVVKGRYRGTDAVGFLIPLGTVLEFLREE